MPETLEAPKRRPGRPPKTLIEAIHEDPTPQTTARDDHPIPEVKQGLQPDTFISKEPVVTPEGLARIKAELRAELLAEMKSEKPAAFVPPPAANVSFIGLQLPIVVEIVRPVDEGDMITDPDGKQTPVPRGPNQYWAKPFRTPNEYANILVTLNGFDGDGAARASELCALILGTVVPPKPRA